METSQNPILVLSNGWPLSPSIIELIAGHRTFGLLVRYILHNNQTRCHCLGNLRTKATLSGTFSYQSRWFSRILTPFKLPPLLWLKVWGWKYLQIVLLLLVKSSKGDSFDFILTIQVALKRILPNAPISKRLWIFWKIQELLMRLMYLQHPTRSQHNLLNK